MHGWRTYIAWPLNLVVLEREILPTIRGCNGSSIAFAVIEWQLTILHKTIPHCGPHLPRLCVGAGPTQLTYHCTGLHAQSSTMLCCMSFHITFRKWWTCLLIVSVSNTIPYFHFVGKLCKLWFFVWLRNPSIQPKPNSAKTIHHKPLRHGEKFNLV